MLTVNVPQGITSIVISNLTESSFYYICIAAINDNGMGPYSEALGFYTGIIIGLNMTNSYCEPKLYMY